MKALVLNKSRIFEVLASAITQAGTEIAHEVLARDALSSRWRSGHRLHTSSPHSSAAEPPRIPIHTGQRT